ncbi:MAG: hypothetical protein E4H44_05270, partial [Candidatus Aminicenantes bacterium]
MNQPPFETDMQLEGWCLFWARLEVNDVDPTNLATRRGQVADAARGRFSDTAAISGDPVVAALRALFRAAGCDPTRYRPASEALLRRLVKGSELPAIFPLVDLNNCLSAELAVPCCVMVEDSFRAPLVWRSGVEGESYESLRGPFNLVDKPVLFDPDGPLDTPITPATSGSRSRPPQPWRGSSPTCPHLRLTPTPPAPPSTVSRMARGSRLSGVEPQGRKEHRDIGPSHSTVATSQTQRRKAAKGSQG